MFIGVLFDAAGPAHWSVVLLGAAATLVLVEAPAASSRGVGGGRLPRQQPLSPIKRTFCVCALSFTGILGYTEGDFGVCPS
jgi:hypothetical protein